MDPRAVRSSPVGKSLVPLPREEARLDPFLGSTIRKSFGAQWYYGQVIAIDVDVASGDRAYHIAYEDGDEEHLNATEVKRFLVIAGRSAPPSDAGGSPHGRRSSMASQRPSLARSEAPRPSMAPSLSLAPVAASVPEVPAVLTRATTGLHGLGFWGSMVVAALAGAALVGAWSSGSFSYLMGGIDLTDELDSRASGLVAPLPPWAEVSGVSKMAAEPFAAAPASLGSAPAVGLEPREGATVERLEVEDVSEEGNPEEPKSWPEETEELAPRDREVEAPPRSSEVEEPQFDPFADAAKSRASQGEMAVLDEDLAMALGAVAEASGLVVRVVAKSFFHSLEQAWHSILSCFSAGLSSAFARSQAEVPSPEPVPEPEEASALQSLMTTILVACAGVVTILVSVNSPNSKAEHLRDVMQISEAMLEAPRKPGSGSLCAPSPRPSPAAPFPSPGAVPLTHLQKAQVRQILEAVNSPARAKSTGCRPEAMTTPLKPARTLMSMMGRTPQAEQLGRELVPLSAERRLPPRPMSLTAPVGNECMPLKNQEACLRCQSLMAPDANFCRHCGQQRGKKVAQVRPPSQPQHHARPRSQEARVKSSLVMEKPRFRYGAALKKLKEMGFNDSSELRDILTKCSGDLSVAIRTINGSPRNRRA